jgi:hypothetical protein
MKKTTKTTKKKTIKVEQPTNLFEVEIKANDEIATTQTDDLLVLLESLAGKVFKTRVLITITHKNKQYLKILNIPMARRLFNNNLNRKIFVNGVKRFFQF